MSFIKAKITGWRELEQNSLKVLNKLETSSRRGLHDAADYVKEQALEILRSDLKGTGEVRWKESILNDENWNKTKSTRGPNGYEVTLESLSPHTQAVEYGTLGADIHAKNSKALSFVYNGVQMFRYRVKGQPPKAFLQKGVYMAKGTLGEMFARRARNVLRRAL